MKKLMIIALVLMLPLSGIAQGIDVDTFITRYNADVVKPSELLDFSLFQKVTQEDGIDTYKCYIMDEEIIAEINQENNGNLYSYCVAGLSQSADNEGTIEKVKLITKAAMHTIVAGSPELDYTEAIMVLYDLNNRAVESNDNMAEYRTDTALYMFAYYEYQGTMMTIFLFSPI